ncbi:hypothetical protein OEW28_04905 [Defluviimonas sp. WL0002]|uniref:Cell division and transport-associated protein TolA n=1 Tax=Albidovulum marisflavi TaxID=2984159 RepID=A0ABT2ZA03_9RHOB|nr:hypothetical protein [Defluviimonas sp. WL0002]MCV2867959.1 hypothetical protein [Defluviimonas sp. WL0002]
MPRDRSKRIGFIVSAGFHLGVILWLLVGGIFFSHDMPPTSVATEVSLISAAEYEAMVAAAPRAPEETPAQPSLPAPPAAEEPAPAPVDEAEPETVTPEPPVAEPEPDVAPDVTELTPPAAEVTDTPPSPIMPPVEEPSATIMTEVSKRPTPRPAPRVAPVPTEAPEPDAAPAPDTVEQTVEAPAEEAQPQETQEAAAPEEAGEVLETEENKDTEEVASAAPLTSARPKARPEKPKTPEAQPETTAAAKPAEPASEAESPSQSDAVADALAEALAGAASEEPAPGTGTAPSGPPMTGGEKDALVVAVKQCWNVGALSTDALRTIVTVSVGMSPDGKPDSSSIRMVSYEGGDETSAKQAFEAGRRAILRCAGEGYPLPREKYEQWKEIEIVFNPEKMRLR